MRFYDDLEGSIIVEVQWLGGRMPDSRSREPSHESPTYNGAVDGDDRIKSYNCTWQ